MTSKAKTDDVLPLVLFLIMAWCGVVRCVVGTLVLPDSRSLLHPVTLTHAHSFTHAIDIHVSAVYHLHFFCMAMAYRRKYRKSIGFIKIPNKSYLGSRGNTDPDLEELLLGTICILCSYQSLR